MVNGFALGMSIFGYIFGCFILYLGITGNRKLKDSCFVSGMICFLVGVLSMGFAFM